LAAELFLEKVFSVQNTSYKMLFYNILLNAQSSKCSAPGAGVSSRAPVAVANFSKAGIGSTVQSASLRAPAGLGLDSTEYACYAASKGDEDINQNISLPFI
jgi:hypothetical protein